MQTVWTCICNGDRHFDQQQNQLVNRRPLTRGAWIFCGYLLQSSKHIREQLQICQFMRCALQGFDEHDNCPSIQRIRRHPFWLWVFEEWDKILYIPIVAEKVKWVQLFCQLEQWLHQLLFDLSESHFLPPTLGRDWSQQAANSGDANLRLVAPYFFEATQDIPAGTPLVIDPSTDHLTFTMIWQAVQKLNDTMFHRYVLHHLYQSAKQPPKRFVCPPTQKLMLHTRTDGKVETSDCEKALWQALAGQRLEAGTCLPWTKDAPVKIVSPAQANARILRCSTTKLPMVQLTQSIRLHDNLKSTKPQDQVAGLLASLKTRLKDTKHVAQLEAENQELRQKLKDKAEKGTGKENGTNKDEKSGHERENDHKNNNKKGEDNDGEKMDNQSKNKEGENKDGKETDNKGKGGGKKDEKTENKGKGGENLVGENSDDKKTEEKDEKNNGEKENKDENNEGDGVNKANQGKSKQRTNESQSDGPQSKSRNDEDAADTPDTPDAKTPSPQAAPKDDSGCPTIIMVAGDETNVLIDANQQQQLQKLQLGQDARRGTIYAIPLSGIASTHYPDGSLFLPNPVVTIKFSTNPNLTDLQHGRDVYYIALRDIAQGEVLSLRSQNDFRIWTNNTQPVI